MTSEVEPGEAVAYVRILYDYTYTTTEGKAISIKEGEECELLKKATAEWWYVHRTGEYEQIYVPANYVEEFNKGDNDQDPVSPSGEYPGIEDSVEPYIRHDSSSSSTQVSPSYEEPEYCNLPIVNVNELSGKLRPESRHVSTSSSSNTDRNSNISISSVDNRASWANQPLDEKRSSTVSYGESGPVGSRLSVNRVNGNNNGDLKGSSSDPGTLNEQGSPDSNKENVQLQDPKDETLPPLPDYANLEEIQATLLRNKAKQPDHRHSLPPAPSVPPGWQLQAGENGAQVYKHELTGERWLCNRDESGRTYYYKESTQETTWALPTVSKSPAAEEDEDIRSKTLPIFTVQDMRGIMSRAKIMENSKKVKKNWTQVYVIMTGGNLYFYKDDKAAQAKQGQPHGKPEAVISLVDTLTTFGATDISSRKNVLQLQTKAGSHYLLHVEDPVKLHSWYINIKHCTQTLVQESSTGDRNGLETSMESETGSVGEEPPPSPGLSVKGGKKKSSKKDKERSSLDRAASVPGPDEQGDKSTIRERLISFFTRRPTMETLQEKGILKDCVFGSTITKICEREKTMVPCFVQQCIKAIDLRGLDVDGVYRVGGSLSQIQKLRMQVDQEKIDVDMELWDIHVLAGALKLFFRELKDPLVPFCLLPRFQSAISIRDNNSKLKAFKDCVKELPKNNKATMKELFQHLCRVMDHKTENRMEVQNIAIVFGPTLMWPELETHNMAASMVTQNKIVEFILLNYKALFPQ